MPTRTEVIQALRARDELQNRDLALILDYLEQEAGDSSGTRATILASRRRIQDEVTPRDIEAIYNYLAELGTPANGFEILRRLLRRRDLFGIQVANFIMDEIDAAEFFSIPDDVLPPGTPHFNASFTHPDQLYTDVGGLTQVAAHGDPINRVNPTGTYGAIFDTATGNCEPPSWDQTTLINGYPTANFTRDSGSAGDGLITTGSVTSVTDRGLLVVIGVTKDNANFGVLCDVQENGKIARAYINSNSRPTAVAADGKRLQTTADVGPGVSFAAYGRMDNTPTATASVHSVAGESEGADTTVVGNSVLQIGCNSTGTSSFLDGYIAQVVWYDSTTPPTKSAIESWVFNKYGLTFI